MTDTIYPHGGGGSAETTFIGQWKPIEAAPHKRGARVIGWCVLPAGEEAREIKCFIPLDRPDAEPVWFYEGIKQTVTHWMPLPSNRPR